MDKDEKLIVGLYYVGLVLCAIPTLIIFLIKKDESESFKFHGLQSLGFFLLTFIIGIVFSILYMIPVLNLLIWIPHLVFALGVLGYWIYLTVKAFSGDEPEIPVLAPFIRSNLM